MAKRLMIWTVVLGIPCAAFGAHVAARSLAAAAAAAKVQTFDAEGVTFHYPGGWVTISPDRRRVVATDTKVLAILADKDPGHTGLVTIEQIFTERSAPEYAADIKAIHERGGRLQSSESLTVDGGPAIELVARMSRLSGGAVLEREIYFGKGNGVYSITCSASSEDYPRLKPRFDVIVKSLHLK